MAFKQTFSVLLLAISFNLNASPLNTVKSVIDNSINQAYQQVILPAVQTVAQTTIGGHTIGALLASYSFVTGNYPFAKCKLSRSQSAGLLATHGCVAALSVLCDGTWTMQDEISHAERSYTLINENKTNGIIV